MEEDIIKKLENVFTQSFGDYAGVMGERGSQEHYLALHKWELSTDDEKKIREATGFKPATMVGNNVMGILVHSVGEVEQSCIKRMLTLKGVT